MNSRQSEIVKYYLRSYFMSSDNLKSPSDQLQDISVIMGISVEKYMNYAGNDYDINLVLGPLDVKRRGDRNKPCLRECEIGMIDEVKKYCRYEPRPVCARNHSKLESTAKTAQSNQPFSSENKFKTVRDFKDLQSIPNGNIETVLIPNNCYNNSSMPDLTVKPSLDAKTGHASNEIPENKKRGNRKNTHKQSEKSDNQTTVKENTIKILPRPSCSDMAIQPVPENPSMLDLTLKPSLDAKTGPATNEIPKNKKRGNRKNTHKQSEKSDNQTTVKENTIKILPRPSCSDMAIQPVPENPSILDLTLKPSLDAKTGPATNEIPKNKKRGNRQNTHKQSEKSENQTTVKENTIKILPRPSCSNMAIQPVPENPSILDLTLKPSLDAKTGPATNEIPKNKKRRNHKNIHKQSEKSDNQTTVKENTITILPRPSCSNIAIQLVPESPSMLDLKLKPSLDAKTGPATNEIPKNKKRGNRKNTHKQSEKSDNQTTVKENTIPILPRPSCSNILVPESPLMSDLSVKPSHDVKTDTTTNEISKNKKRRNRKNKHKQSEEFHNQTTEKENTIKILRRP